MKKQKYVLQIQWKGKDIDAMLAHGIKPSQYFSSKFSKTYGILNLYGISSDSPLVLNLYASNQSLSEALRKANNRSKLEVTEIESVGNNYKKTIESNTFYLGRTRSDIEFMEFWFNGRYLEGRWVTYLADNGTRYFWRPKLQTFPSVGKTDNKDIIFGSINVDENDGEYERWLKKTSLE